MIFVGRLCGGNGAITAVLRVFSAFPAGRTALRLSLYLLTLVLSNDASLPGHHPDSPAPPASPSAGSLARSVRKLLVAPLRTRLLLFTLLLALVEVNGLHPGAPRQTGLRQKYAFRLPWFMTAVGYSFMSQRRYRSAPRTTLRKSHAWCTNVLLKSSDSCFQECMHGVADV